MIPMEISIASESTWDDGEWSLKMRGYQCQSNREDYSRYNKLIKAAWKSEKKKRTEAVCKRHPCVLSWIRSHDGGDIRKKKEYL